MPDPKTFEKLRPCGLLEKFSTARHNLGLYSNVGGSALYYSPKSGSSSIETSIFRALAAVVAHHPSLSAIPVDEDQTTTYFVRLPKIDLKDAVIFVDRKQNFDDTNGADDPELAGVLQEYHNKDQKYRYGEVPFWKLIILREPDNHSRFVAAFVFHHALGDGMSSLAFHRCFLRALRDVEARGDEEKEFSTTLISPDAPMLPTIEELHKLPLSIRYLGKAVVHEYIKKPDTTDIWTGGPISFDPDKRRRRLRSRAFSSDFTSKLVSAARANSTSVTGALEAAFASALFANLDSAQFKRLHVDGAVSFRRFLPEDVVTEDSMGCWVSRFDHEHHRGTSVGNGKSADANALWEEAKAVKKSIDSEVAKNGKNAVAGLLRWAGDLKQFFLKRDGKERGNSFELSNVGVFQGPPAGNADDSDGAGWRIGRMLFSQSADLSGPPLHVTVVTGGDGCLSIGFCWVETNFEEEWFDKVLQDFRANLEKMI